MIVCVFVHRQREPVKKGSFAKMVMYGEMSTVPLDQLTAMVDTVCKANIQHKSYYR